ncbi:hypothetical protein AB0L82_35975 [Nocardia sp. NPDC052001]|uniref:hypothetical protein n=1 Tax=Nocardia sp. NPDC052001 TaxID=3154853 RepID=UPI003439B00B
MSPTTPETDYAAGDLIVLSHRDVPEKYRDGIYAVIKSKNGRLTLENLTNGLECTVDHRAAHRATDQEIQTLETALAALPPLHRGSFVTLPDDKQTHIVVAVPNRNARHYHVTLPGGDNGRYQRVTRGALTLDQDARLFTP